MGIDIIAFCDNDEKKWDIEFECKNVIFPEELQEMYHTEDILVQIGSIYEKEIAEQLVKMNIHQYILTSEAKTRLTWYKLKQKNFSYYYDKYSLALDMEIASKLFKSLILEDELHLLCMPPKTGNYTIVSSLDYYNLSYVNTWHRPRIIDKNLIKDLTTTKVKILSAVCDPVEQNISIFFQNAGEPTVGSGTPFFQYADWSDGGDAQKMYQEYIMAREKDLYHDLSFIQDFFPIFCRSVLDVLNYPFDQKKGYSIIRLHNMEILIFQLEKINENQNVILKWLGCPDDAKLFNCNLSSDKWYANAYQQTKKELKIPRAYFEKCYNNPYIKHFYHAADSMYGKRSLDKYYCIV